MSHDEQRVRTMAGWIGVEISRSRVRTPGKAGYGLYRVRWLERYNEQDSITGMWSEDLWRPTLWTAYAFTLEEIRRAVQVAIDGGTGSRPGVFAPAPWGDRRQALRLPARWTSAYRGRRDLGTMRVVTLPEEPFVVAVRPEYAAEVSALAALVGAGLVVMTHAEGCLCEGTARLTAECVRLSVAHPEAARRVRIRQELDAAGEAIGPSGYPIGLASCGCPNRRDGSFPALHRCGRCGFVSGFRVHEECAGCRETVRSRQREHNAEFQEEHLKRRAWGLEQRHARKLARGGHNGGGLAPQRDAGADGEYPG